MVDGGNKTFLRPLGHLEKDGPPGKIIYDLAPPDMKRREEVCFRTTRPQEMGHPMPTALDPSPWSPTPGPPTHPPPGGAGGVGGGQGGGHPDYQ